MVVVHGSVNVDAIRKVATQILKELQEKKEVAWEYVWLWIGDWKFRVGH